MKKRKRGAPKKKNPKQVTRSLRLAEEHNGLFQAAADKMSISFSAWMRIAALEYLKTREKG